jgi:hypothetical protein
MNLSGIFNSSLSTATFMNSMTSYFTGSDTITLLIILSMLLVIAFIFRMPEILMAVALLPIIIIFAFVDPTYWTILAIIVTIAGIGLFSLFKR